METIVVKSGQCEYANLLNETSTGAAVEVDETDAIVDQNASCGTCASIGGSVTLVVCFC